MHCIERIELDGDWNLYELGATEIIAATVPGSIHTDLMAADKISDPYYRDNETALEWIAQKIWVYERNFWISEEWVNSFSTQLLRADGLDTLAELELNGTVLGRADNMFRTWEFPVAAVLRPGDNQIRITFYSPLGYISKKQKEHYYAQAGVIDERIAGSCWLRKEQCNFGWDWGPRLVTAGIWRSIGLVGRTHGELSSVHLRQDWDADGSVRLHPELVIQGDCSVPMLVDWKLEEPSGIPVGEWSHYIDETVDFRLEKPVLWWPNGLGEPTLYRLTCCLRSEDGLLLDERNQRIGFRQIELVQHSDEWGHSFHFQVNGIDFFAKGANWIPADCFDSRVSDGDLWDLLKSAVDVHMNMIRVWGGGIYERDRFYELCDELGLCVWQDFMFACAAYPFDDKDFQSNVAAEATEVVLRLKAFTSLVCWCGNNEIEQMAPLIGNAKGAMRAEEYEAGFVTLLGGIVKKLNPERAYFPSSAHTPFGEGLVAWDESSGDVHTWDVWHGRKPIPYYRETFPRFCSEFGFQSFPEPGTIAQFSRPEDRAIHSEIMLSRQRSQEGNAIIESYMEEEYGVPVPFDSFVWMSQILQAQAVKTAVEHWRRNIPRCMGALYWQLNDTWPCPSWSSIDHSHRWKALHYAAKRFFAPVLLSALADKDTLSAEAFITCDPMHSFSGELRWLLQSAEGETLGQGLIEVELPERTTRKVIGLDAETFGIPFEGSRTVLGLSLWKGDEQVASEMILWESAAKLALVDPRLMVRWTQQEAGAWLATLKAEKPSPCVWLSSAKESLRCNDNFFPLMGGEERTIAVEGWSEGGNVLVNPDEVIAQTLFGL